ncbi:MAG: hypothetical protein KKD44_05105 [Proteobacteria bacterium]|nr:hypothetical protein [Pseudomonadota bacterium]
MMSIVKKNSNLNWRGAVHCVPFLIPLQRGTARRALRVLHEAKRPGGGYKRKHLNGNFFSSCPWTPWLTCFLKTQPPISNLFLPKPDIFI